MRQVQFDALASDRWSCKIIVSCINFSEKMHIAELFISKKVAALVQNIIDVKILTYTQIVMLPFMISVPHMHFLERLF